ncbi:hypothetical protein HHX47_DHR2000566 [Lentinula edodes]|nr:hypothetical protein HHX47_DHR2000566 [Lentinula edodes]
MKADSKGRERFWRYQGSQSSLICAFFLSFSLAPSQHIFNIIFSWLQSAPHHQILLLAMISRPQHLRSPLIRLRSLLISPYSGPKHFHPLLPLRSPLIRVKVVPSLLNLPPTPLLDPPLNSDLSGSGLERFRSAYKSSQKLVLPPKSQDLSTEKLPLHFLLIPITHPITYLYRIAFPPLPRLLMPWNRSASLLRPLDRLLSSTGTMTSLPMMLSEPLDLSLMIPLLSETSLAKFRRSKGTISEPLGRELQLPKLPELLLLLPLRVELVMDHLCQLRKLLMRLPGPSWRESLLRMHSSLLLLKLKQIRWSRMLIRTEATLCNKLFSNLLVKLRVPPLLVHPLDSLPVFWRQLLIFLLSLLQISSLPLFLRLGNCGCSSLWTVMLTPQSVYSLPSHSLIPYLSPCSNSLSRIGMWTLKRFMLPSLVTLVSLMIALPLAQSTNWSRKSTQSVLSLSHLKHSGSEFLMPGLPQCLRSIPIVRVSFLHTRHLLWSFSGLLHQIPLLPLEWTGRRARKLLTLPLTLEMQRTSDSCCLRNFSVLENVPAPLLALLLLQSARILLVSFGMRGNALPHVQIAASMASVVSVESPTKQLTPNPAMRSLSTVDQRVKTALAGPRSLAGTKRATPESNSGSSNSIPRFRRGYLWSTSSSSSEIIPPSIQSTYTAPPLPSPPEHLLNNPQIQSTLKAMAPYIKVETPFNVDRLENLLASHPNQPFVASVMRSLREGFWPFYEAEWEVESKQKLDNYVSEPQDFAALRAHRDQEVAAGRWSEALPEDFVLLPGMKVSPMFVVWQKGKPRVVMDHTGSGLNDNIPKAEGKVKYDDMHTFGQFMIRNLGALGLKFWLNTPPLSEN